MVEKYPRHTPVPVGLFFSFFPYITLLVAAAYFGESENFLRDYRYALAAFIMGFMAGGTIAFRKRMGDLEAELHKSTHVEVPEESEWKKNMCRLLHSRTQYGVFFLMTSIVIIYLYLFPVELSITGRWLYVVFLFSFVLPAGVVVLSVAWTMIVELLFIYNITTENGHPNRLVMGTDWNRFPALLRFVKGDATLRIRVRLLHHDGLCGLRPIVNLAIFGSLMEGVVFSVIVIVLPQTAGRMGLVVAVFLGAFILMTTWFIISKVKRPLQEARSQKLDRITERIEQMEGSVLGNAWHDDEEAWRNKNILDTYQKLRSMHMSAGHGPLDLGIIVQIISGAAIPLLLFFMGSLLR